MSFPVPGKVNAADQSHDGEWVVTLTDGLVTKVERIDDATNTRRELSAEEYARMTASYSGICYAMYYMGIHDYVEAVASGNIQLAEAYLQGMTAFFGATGQT